jgi:hypothetical protein
MLVSQNRMLCACGDYEATRGLSYKPDDLEKMREQGFIGYKIYGPCYLRFLLATYPNFNIYD